MASTSIESIQKSQRDKDTVNTHTSYGRNQLNFSLPEIHLDASSLEEVERFIIVKS